jgi:hypothetical protein
MAAAADRGCLRASHADREQAIDLLKAAFVQGRLTESELDARVGQALASRTQAELATLTADLPAGLIAAPTRRKPARARPQLPGRKVAAGAGLTIPPAALMAVAFLSNNEHLSEACFLVISWFLVAWILAGTQMLAKWYDKRSAGPLPPPLAQHGRELEGEQDNGPGGDLVPCESQYGVRARHRPGAGVFQWARRSLPECQPGRRPARLQISA